MRLNVFGGSPNPYFLHYGAGRIGRFLYNPIENKAGFRRENRPCFGGKSECFAYEKGDNLL